MVARRLSRTVLVHLALAVGLTIAAPIAHAADDETPAVQIDGRVETDNHADEFDWIIGLAQLGATLAAVAGLFLLRRQLMAAKDQISAAERQISGAREDANAQRALSFQETYTGREFRKVASLALAFLDVSDAADCIQKVRAAWTSPYAEAPCLPRSPRDPSAPQPCLNDVDQVLGFLEALGTAHRRGLVDGQVLLMGFGTIPVQFFTTGWWYIAIMRGGAVLPETELYAHFEELVRWLRGQDAELCEMVPEPRVRLLAMPSEEDERDWGAWDLCERLSQAMSEHLAADPSRRVTDVLVAVGCAAAPFPRRDDLVLIASVVAVPPAIDIDAEAWGQQLRDAAAIVDRLRGVDADGVEAVIRALDEQTATLRDEHGARLTAGVS